MQVTLCSQLEMPIIFQMWRRKTVLANLEFFPHPASLWYWNLNRPDWRSMAPNKRVCLVSSELQISCSPNFAFQSLVLRGGAVQASANTPRLRLLYQNDSAQHQTLLLVRVTKQAQAWVPEWLCSEPNPTACYGNKASPLHKQAQAGTIWAGEVRKVMLHAYICLEGSDKIGTKQKKLLQHYQ